jgi:hypothetical protein
MLTIMLTTHELANLRMSLDFRHAYIRTNLFLATQTLNAQILYSTSGTPITDILEYKYNKLTGVVLSTGQDRRMEDCLCHSHYH